MQIDIAWSLSLRPNTQLYRTETVFQMQCSTVGSLRQRHMRPHIWPQAAAVQCCSLSLSLSHLRQSTKGSFQFLQAAGMKAMTLTQQASKHFCNPSPSCLAGNAIHERESAHKPAGFAL